MKKYLPAILIGGVALYLAYLIQRNKAPTQIINRAIPTATTTSIVDTRDPYRVEAFSQLASLAGLQKQQETQLAIAGKQFEAEQARLQNAFSLANLQTQQASSLEASRQQGQLELARIGAERDIETARLAGAQYQYDREQQRIAQERMYDVISSNQTQNTIGSILNSILRALQQRQQSPGGAQTPPTFPTRQQPRSYSIPEPTLNTGFFNWYPYIPDWPEFIPPFFPSWPGSSGPIESEYPVIDFPNLDYPYDSFSEFVDYSNDGFFSPIGGTDPYFGSERGDWWNFLTDYV